MRERDSGEIVQCILSIGIPSLISTKIGRFIVAVHIQATVTVLHKHRSIQLSKVLAASDGFLHRVPEAQYPSLP